MTETSAPLRTTDAPAFPSNRTCPYQLPASYARLRDEPDALRAVTLYDGRQAWVVTKHETARKLLADP
ncbi:cytochrome P450, partial [Streptomyces chrestomyceticus]